MLSKIFISYGHDSEEHQDAVLNLADRLREEGANCIIDQYEESPPEGWPRWASNQIEEAEFVLVVCTEQYSRQFAGKGEAVEGRSANWQGAIITQSLYDSQSNNKFIPIALSAQDAAHIPVLLRGATAYVIDAALGYEELYRRLTGQFATPMPLLGAIQKLPRRDRLQFFLNEDRQDSLKEEFLSASKGVLDWKRTLGNDQQITRPELVQLTDRIETETSSTTIVLGSPGCGKSALMATLGHWAVDETYVLLALKADYLSNTVNTLEDLQHGIHLSSDVRDAIMAIASTDKVILLIDQLDAVAEMLDRQPGRLNVLLSLIQSLAGTKNVHIVATCREFEFRHGTQFARLESFERMDLHLPSWEDIIPFLEKEKHNPKTMGETLRELLQNPLHLRIFLEIAKPGDVFESLPKLLDQLWQLGIVDKPQPKESIVFLTELADQMTEEEVLWLPSAIADENPEICRALEQAGILMTNPENSTLGFCHQTFYDHTLARSFARRGSNLLVELVLERQDGIFVRPILLRSLNYLRGTASSRYQQQLKTLLTSFDQPIRTHIRTLLLEFVGAQTKPNATEAGLLIPLLNSETEGIKVLDAMVGSPGWFRKLRDRTEFRQWLEKPVEQAIYCCPLLTAAARFAVEDVWGLLEEYWLYEQTYDFLSIRVIRSIVHWTSTKVNLVQRLVHRSNIAWHDVAEISEQIAEFLPNEAAKIIRSHLDQKLEQAIASSKVSPPELSSDANEMQKYNHIHKYDPKKPLKDLLESVSDFHEIEKFAEINPEAFLESTWQWFTNVINQISREPYAGYLGYREDNTNSLSDHHGEIIEAILTAVLEFAEKDKFRFLKFATENFQSDLRLVHRLLARGLEKIVDQLPKAVLEYLLGDPRRLCLGDSLDGEHDETKRLISAVCPYLSLDDRKMIENSICQFNYRDLQGDFEPTKRFQLLQNNRHHRLQLLLAFSEECLSSEGKQLRDAESRAFPWEVEEHRNPSVIEAYSVGPRMTKDEMALAKKTDLLNLFNELSDQPGGERNQRWRSIDPSRSGGSGSQAHEFGELVKNDPNYFLQLLSDFQPGHHEIYAAKALASLAEISFPSSDLIQFVEIFEQRGFTSEEFRNDVASALEKVARSNQGLPKRVLALMETWLPTQTKPGIEHYRSKEDQRSQLKSPILFGARGFHSLPSGRGNIVRAIAEGYLRQNPSDLAGWANFIRKQLEVESHPAIWVDILGRMPLLLNADREEATKLFDQVIHNCPDILQYAWVLYHISHTIGWFKPKETVQGWLEMLQLNDSSFSQQAYGELLLIQYLQYQDEWSIARIRNYLTNQDNEAILCGLAYAASHLWGRRKCQTIATEILCTLASSSNLRIQYAVASVFHRNHNHFVLNPGMVKLIQAICKNEGILLEAADNLTEIIEAEELVDNHPELVAKVCQNLIRIGPELTNPSRATAFIGENLTTIAIQLHRQPFYREVGLQIFEQLLTLNLRETRLALEALDRKPNRPDSYLAPRRKIRGRRTRR